MKTTASKLGLVELISEKQEPVNHNFHIVKVQDVVSKLKWKHPDSETLHENTVQLDGIRTMTIEIEDEATFKNINARRFTAYDRLDESTHELWMLHELSSKTPVRFINVKHKNAFSRYK